MTANFGLRAVALAAGWLLAACGGDGGGNTDSEPSAPITSSFTVIANMTGRGNATVSPSSATVTRGGITSFTISLDAGSTIASVTGCGGSLIGETYTTGPVDANCTVTITLDMATYEVTTLAGDGGTISPSVVTVSHGESVAFTVTPEIDREVEDVQGCNGTLSGMTYTTSSITASCTVSATFRHGTVTVPPPAQTYSVTTSITGDGSGVITPRSSTVHQGHSVSLEITPDDDSEIGSVSGCDGTLSGTTYVTGPINADCQITASLLKRVYHVTVNVGAGGWVSPTMVLVPHGDTTVFSITPDHGYLLFDVDGCPGELADYRFVTQPITESCQLSVTFRKDASSRWGSAIWDEFSWH